MRKIALITLTALPLFAGFFPQTIHTSITHADKKSLTLASAFPVNGMSGVIVHNYGNEVEAITARVIQNNTNNVKLVPNDIIKHNKLPTISTKAIAGDKVIGGYLYNNVLVLAPDAKTYADITSTDNKNWIHPDLYALFLTNYGDNVPTKRNLKSFAKKYQVGLIYIVSHTTAKLLDPISGKIVGQKSISNLPEKGKSPFFMRFDEIDSGLFSSSNTKSYYKIMDNL
jgi:hypothetical protein